MEIVAKLLSCALTPLCSSSCNQCNYIRKYKEHKETFERELEQLKRRGNDLSDEVNRGKQQHGKNPKEEVTLWLENRQKLVDRIESTKIENESSMCLRGRCPNCYFRWKRGKLIEKLMDEVRDLQVKSHFPDGLFVDSLPALSFPATTLQGSSAERKKDEILQCIMDPEVSKIGVFGMGGVGKTTIMTQIYNQLKESGDFDIVMWVTVSSSFNLEKLQDKIAELLGCPLSSSADETSRAMMLHEAFKRRRNFVIILDDVWDIVSLRNVGIPEPDRSNGSKIVWTTRSIKVCNGMESQRQIKVEGLTNVEAWSLFRDKVGGEDVIVSPAIEGIARQVAKECAGLPLALITVGCAMRKTFQLEVWRNALQELKSSSTEQIDGMGKDVFGSLKFSYSRLSNDKVRSCFLYCALYPEDDDIYVDELIEYWMAEGLINEEGSIEREKDKGDAILKELKDACMIESHRRYDNFVRMHDLIRDLAINITREPPIFMVKSGIKLRESPNEEEWVESLERVSLMYNDIKAFKGQPNCPRLSTLLLQQNSHPVTFSDTFFKYMHNLRVLDLSSTEIESLPDSLFDLTNLHALILMACRELKCLPSLAELQKLRWLELTRLSSLTELPHGFENLVKLRHLDISHGEWTSFPAEALSKITGLEILFMHHSKWRLSCGNDHDEKDNLVFGEVISLKNLTKFSVDFGDVLTFNSYINKFVESELLKHLDYFLFGVCYSNDGHNVENESMEKVILPDTANYLGIDGYNFIQLSDIFGLNDLRQLIDCIIYHCDEMEGIQKDEEIVLPNLKKLMLADLHSFMGLCKETTHGETLKNLTQLSIYNCSKLKYLIPIDLLLNNLQNLEEISIEDCSDMEEIILGKANATTIILPKLKKLVLWKLPILTSICEEKLVCDLICETEVGDCPNMNKLPFLINNVPSFLKRIGGSKEWWETLEWDDPQLKQLLQPFFDEETFGYCDQLRGLDAEENRGVLNKQMIKIGKRLYM